MLKLLKNGQTSVVLRVKLRSTVNGNGLTGLTSGSSGLIVGTIADNEAATTRYRASSSEVETIATLGTFAAPTAGKCRFKEVDSAAHPGLYEIQIADARWAVSSAKSVIVSVFGAASLVETDAEVQLNALDLFDSVRLGLTALPNAAAGANGGLPLGDASGRTDVGKWLGTAVSTPTVAGVPNVNTKTWNDLATVALPLVPATAGRTLVVDAAGLADANMVKAGPTGSGTAQTARDIGGVFVGITLLAQWLGAMAGKQTANSTARTEIRATGAGSGTFDETTDANEAIRDRGDAAYLTATAVTVSDKTGFSLSAAGIQAVWDALSSALTTVGSIGKRLVDDITGDIYARLGAPAGASVSADVAAVKAVLPSALVSGRIDASVGAMAANVLTASAINADAITAAKVADGTIDAATFAAGAINAAAIAADAITDAKVAADVTIASVTGAVGSVTGAVGSVAGNVGGNVTGSVGSVATGGISAASFAAGAIDAAAIATDAIGSSELAASAIAEIQAGLSTLDAAGVRSAVGLASANLDTQLDALPTAAENRAEMDSNSTKLASIDGKTTNLPSDPADESLIIATTDAIVAAIGALNNLSQANVRTAVGLASANLDTQLDALPTNAELATALGTADDATLAAIAALTIPTADQNATALLDLANGVETGMTPRQTLRLMAAVLLGKLSGADTNAPIFRDVNDTKDRVTATTTDDGNRTAVTRDAS